VPNSIPSLPNDVLPLPKNISSSQNDFPSSKNHFPSPASGFLCYQSHCPAPTAYVTEALLVCFFLQRPGIFFDFPD
jgi:hypothetical protein